MFTLANTSTNLFLWVPDILVLHLWKRTLSNLGLHKRNRDDRDLLFENVPCNSLNTFSVSISFNLLHWHWGDFVHLQNKHKRYFSRNNKTDSSVSWLDCECREDGVEVFYSHTVLNKIHQKIWQLCEGFLSKHLNTTNQEVSCKSCVIHGNTGLLWVFRNLSVKAASQGMKTVPWGFYG